MLRLREAGMAQSGTPRIFADRTAWCRSARPPTQAANSRREPGSRRWVDAARGLRSCIRCPILADRTDWSFPNEIGRELKA
jgi:hypothetical protein